MNVHFLPSRILSIYVLVIKTEFLGSEDLIVVVTQNMDLACVICFEASIVSYVVI